MSDIGVEPVVGETYNVYHTRKGRFVMRVDAVRGEWVDGEVVRGTAKAMLPYNKRAAGEGIVVRRSFCTFTPEPPHV